MNTATDASALLASILDAQPAQEPAQEPARVSSETMRARIVAALSDGRPLRAVLGLAKAVNATPGCWPEYASALVGLADGTRDEQVAYLERVPAILNRDAPAFASHGSFHAVRFAISRRCLAAGYRPAANAGLPRLTGSPRFNATETDSVVGWQDGHESVLAGCRSGADVAHVSGIDWTVHVEPLQTPDGQVAPDRALRRSDNSFYLGTVGSRYEPIQNSQALAVLDPLFQREGTRAVGAGFFDGGRVVFAQVDLGINAEIVPGDSIRPLLHFRTGHGGNKPCAFFRSDVRIVCRNTLAMASRAGNLLARIRHTASAKDRLTDVEEFLSGFRQEVEADLEFFRSLYKTQVSEKIAKEILDDLFGVGQKADRARANAEARVSRVLALFDGEAKGSEMAGQTGWGLLNALTEWADHESVTARGEPTLAQQEFSRQEGVAAQFKARAMSAVGGILTR